MGVCQCKLELIEEQIEAASGRVHPPKVFDEPEWTTPNHEINDLAALRVREFAVGSSRHRPIVVVAPFALHDAGDR